MGSVKSSWRPVTDGVPQESVRGPILSNRSWTLHDLGDGPQYTLSKFADDTKLGRVADTPAGCAGVQRHLYVVEQESHEVKQRKVQSPACRKE